ncbi:MAG: HlyD family type I secretion periplasmic adaptor subunit [Desulfobacteraceae bacterium]|nr:HlyD family type I secretion periplasmic adaptor subunit [Desulfobacteraceae bacterium]
MSLKHRLQAYGFLVKHYGSVFGRYWKIRKQLDGNLFREDEAEFLPAALSLQEQPVSPASRLVAWLLMLLVFVLFAWSIFGRMDIIVNATGEIIPSGRTKAIASVEVASVKAIYVDEGQKVKKGDVLIDLDASLPDAEHDKAMSSIVEATLQRARAQAMIAAVDSRTPPQLSPIKGISEDKLREAQNHLDGQFQDFMARLQRIDATITRYQDTLPLAKKQAKDYQELLKSHDVLMQAYLEKEQALVDMEGQLAEAKKQRAALVADVKRAAYEAQTEADKVLGAARQDAMRTASHSKLLRLTAPVDGTVQQLMVHTVGGVVPAAQPLMQIVPKEEHLEVEAFLENKDIGFVEEGQTAAIKIDAFDYTRYGTIPGQVRYVSRDAIKDEKRGLIYSVRVTMDKSTILVHGHKMELGPGMSVNVEIKTGSRRVIEYVLSPLLQNARESLHER